MPYTPCVLIGLGGTGTDVVEIVRQHVLNATRYDPELQERLVDRTFRFLAVDTTLTIRDRRRMPASCYHALTVEDAHQFTHQAEKDDPFFDTWWYGPPNWPTSYRPGAIATMHWNTPLAARLAWYADLRGGFGFGRHLEEALQDLREIAERGERDVPIMVYLVSSLCGATGSGLFLSVAHQVRDFLEDSVTIIGVVATASVLNLVAQDKDHIGARCCAGLNSLDLWLDPDEQQREPYLPFFVSSHKSIEGRGRKPVNLCYLVTRWNGQQRSIGDDVRSYLRLMADGIFLEIMASGSERALERREVFHTHFRDRPLDCGRPVHYGSFGVAGMRYDVDRITEWLAMRFSQRVLDAWFLSPSDASRTTSDLARTFMANALVSAREEMRLPAPLDIRDRLMQAERGEVLTVIEEFEEVLLKQLGLEPKGPGEAYLTLAEVMRANADELYERTVEAVDKQVAELLRGSDDAFEVAHNFVHDLTAEIEAHREEIRVECDGNKARQTLGYDDDIRELQAKREEMIDAILDASRIRQGAKKREFIEEWWEPWENAMTQLAIRRRAVDFYGRLLDYLGLLRDGFGRMEKTLTELRDEFLKGYPTILGQRRGKGAYVLEEAILDSADAVDRTFLQDKGLPPGCSSESLLAGEQGVIADLGFLCDLLKVERKQEASAHEKRMKDELRDVFLRRGREEFESKVSALTLWDALELEAKHAGHTASTAIKKYVEHKVRECAACCSPAWQLDEAVSTAENLHPLHNGTLIFNEEAWAAFEERHGAIDLWSLVENAVGLRAQHVPTPDHHCFMIRMVEGRAPLYLLRESGELVDTYYRFRKKSPDVPLYVDVRYENLPMRLLRPERYEGRLTLLLAEFLGSQFPETELGRQLQTPIQAEEPRPGAYCWKGTVFARSRREAYDKMHPREEIYQELAAAVREVWADKIPPADERATFEALADWLDRRARQRESAPDIRLLVEQDVELIISRIASGQTHPW